MPRDEGLREADLGDQLRDGGFSFCEAADDPEPVDIGEGLVDEPQLAEIARLDDGGRDRRADAGRGWGQGSVSVAVVSTTVYINRG